MDLNKITNAVNIVNAKKAVSLLVLSFVLGSAFIAAPMANAGLNEMRSGLGTAAGDLKTERSVPEVVGSIINAVLALIGVLLLVYLIYAGFLWMTAGGDEGKVKQAISMIRNAIIGILIITLSFVIADTVLDLLIQSFGGGSVTSQ